jgi:hypothetical protein
MKRNRHIGLERRDGYDVGRDPRSMSAAELEDLGHSRVSPLRALRMKCLDCCNGSAQEVRLCTDVDCPNWPFRMSRNPWRAPLSDAGRSGRLARLAPKTASAPTEALKTHAQIGNSVSDGGRVPSDEVADFPPIENSADAGGAA